MSKSERAKRQSRRERRKKAASRGLHQPIDLDRLVADATQAFQQEAWGRVIELAASVRTRSGTRAGTHVGTPTDAANDPRAQKLNTLETLEGQARFHLGMRLRQDGKWDAARQELEHASTLCPYDARIWYTLGITCVEIGEYDHALEAYDQALAIQPHAPQILYEAALATIAHSPDDPANSPDHPLQRYLSVLENIDPVRSARVHRLLETTGSLNEVTYGTEATSYSEPKSIRKSALKTASKASKRQQTNRDYSDDYTIEMIKTVAAIVEDKSGKAFLAFCQDHPLMGGAGIAVASLKSWAVAMEATNSGDVDKATDLAEMCVSWLVRSGSQKLAHTPYAKLTPEGAQVADADLRASLKSKGGTVKGHQKRRSTRHPGQVDIFDALDIDPAPKVLAKRELAATVEHSATKASTPIVASSKSLVPPASRQAIESVLAMTFWLIGENLVSPDDVHPALEVLSTALSCYDHPELRRTVALLLYGIDDGAEGAVVWEGLARSIESRAEEASPDQEQYMRHEAALVYEIAADLNYHWSMDQFEPDDEVNNREVMARLQRADGQLKKARRLWPEVPSFQVKLALLSMLRNENRRAIKLAKDALERHRKVLTAPLLDMIVSVASYTGDTRLEKEALTLLGKKEKGDQEIQERLGDMLIDEIKEAVRAENTAKALDLVSGQLRRGRSHAPEISAWNQVLEAHVAGVDIPIQVPDEYEEDGALFALGLAEALDALGGHRKEVNKATLLAGKYELRSLAPARLADLALLVISSGGGRTRARQWLKRAVKEGGFDTLSYATDILIEADEHEEALPFARRLELYTYMSALNAIPYAICLLATGEIDKGKAAVLRALSAARRDRDQEAIRFCTDLLNRL